MTEQPLDQQDTPTPVEGQEASGSAVPESAGDSQYGNDTGFAEQAVDAGEDVEAGSSSE